MENMGRAMGIELHLIWKIRYKNIFDDAEADLQELEVPFCNRRKYKNLSLSLIRA